MRRVAITVGTLILAAAVGHAARAVTIDDLAWLSGAWEAVGAEPGCGETWTMPAGGTMLGVGRTVQDGETVAWEFLLIRETTAHALVYIAQPSGQDEATFTLEELAPGRVVFANPTHDYPQRIIYQLQDDGTLLARIEGDVDGELRTVDFPLRRP